MRYNKQWGFSDSIRNLGMRLNFFIFIFDAIKSLFVLLKFFSGFFLLFDLFLLFDFLSSLFIFLRSPFNLANIALSFSPLFYNEYNLLI
jgi:hypothetical protein